MNTLRGCLLIDRTWKQRGSEHFVRNVRLSSALLCKFKRKHKCFHLWAWNCTSHTVNTQKALAVFPRFQLCSTLHSGSWPAGSDVTMKRRQTELRFGVISWTVDVTSVFMLFPTIRPSHHQESQNIDLSHVLGHRRLFVSANAGSHHHSNQDTNALSNCLYLKPWNTLFKWIILITVTICDGFDSKLAKRSAPDRVCRLMRTETSSKRAPAVSSFV